jgi:hypothetical protein
MRTALLTGLLCVGTLFAAEAPGLRLTATTENVTGAPDKIRIDILRWSTDAERQQLMSAWNMTNVKAPTAAPGRGPGRAAAGRGGRGRGPAEAEDMPRPTPEGTLTAALQQAATIGYLWSSEVAGYAIRYAKKTTAADGSDRIILITDRRLGLTSDLWNLKAQDAPSPYAFSVIELRVNPAGIGEGKVSLTGKVAPDTNAGVLAPSNYEALPVVLKDVKRSKIGSTEKP